MAFLIGLELLPHKTFGLIYEMMQLPSCKHLAKLMITSTGES